MLYTIGTNYADGWAMVEGKNGKNVIYKHLETPGIALNKTTFGNCLTAEVINDSKVVIYQFFPGDNGYIAAYEFVVEYPTAVYVAGTNNGWDAANAEKLTMTQPGVYEGLVTFNAEDNGRGRFELSTKKGDWDADFNAHKIGSDAEGAFWFEETDKVPTVMGKNSGFSVKLPGTYNMVVNLANNYVALYPENVYVIGNLANRDWETITDPNWDTTSDRYMMTYDGNGEYSIENVIVRRQEIINDKAVGYLSFITAIGANWDAVNARPRYGAATANAPLTSVGALDVFRAGGDANAWMVERGQAKFTLNLRDMKVSASILSGVDEAEAVAAAKVIAGQGFIEVVGEAENVEVYTVAGALVSAGQKSIECAAGIYLVKVDGNVTKVIVR